METDHPQGLTPAWYIVRGQARWKAWLNSLHAPYTLLHLGFVGLGAGLAPAVHWDRTLWMLAAFALAMGGAAHWLDLVRGDPLRLAIPRQHLYAAAGVALAAAMAIGVWWTTVLGEWFIILVGLGGLFVVGYNLEWRIGPLPLHGDQQFALMWGAFPFTVGYLANDPAATLPLAMGAAFCYVASLAQRALSTRVRFLRRQLSRATVLLWTPEGLLHEASALSEQDLVDDRTVPLGEDGRGWMLGPLEQALMLLSFAMPLLAVAALVA